LSGLVEYIPTVDEETVHLLINDENVHLDLVEPRSASDFKEERFRIQHYNRAEGLILLYSIASKESFDNIQKKWILEIRENAPGRPVILVGAKIDLRETFDGSRSSQLQSVTTVTKHMGENLAKEIGAVAFFEVSSLKQINHRSPFQRMAEELIGPADKDTETDSDLKSDSHRKCTIS
jgi:GTPase SAR1 family protein